jgi:hypothetical protein
MARMGIREYARHRGCGHASVLRAIDSGRLQASLGFAQNGTAFIADHELADREWQRNTDLSRAPLAVKLRADQHRPAPAPIGNVDFEELLDLLEGEAEYYRALVFEFLDRFAAERPEAKPVVQVLRDRFVGKFAADDREKSDLRSGRAPSAEIKQVR